ncbi:hypothetical protein [uncultured Thiodictyon sp.]|uniref:hypothetical protein n=1 Tax=uncultured Thiodictyon sp. TaxID=1846217 RepID=UPI00345C09C0
MKTDQSIDLSQVLQFWFFERFRALTAKDIWAMLNLVTPIQETRAYQSIFAEGEAKGKAEGIAEGEAEVKAEANSLQGGTVLARTLCCNRRLSATLDNARWPGYKARRSPYCPRPRA